MSRVAKKPIPLAKGIDCTIADDVITIKGPKGTLTTKRPANIDVKVENGVIKLSATREQMAMAGTLRALLNNMVTGVSSGFERKLELVGVGFRAAMQGKELSLSLGFSHPVLFSPPAGVTIETPSQTEIIVKGADKQAVGQTAAKIRSFRPPEPYKGKGVRYAGEKILLKEAKKA